MFLDLFSKAISAAEAARDNLDAGHADDAVNRAYYAMYNAARAFLASQGRDIAGSHGAIVRDFGRYAVLGGVVGADLGRLLNRAQEARSVADYGEESVPVPDALALVEGAERFVDAIGALLPDLPAMARRGPSARQREELKTKGALAEVLRRAAEARGVTLPPSQLERLIQTGTTETLTALIAAIDEASDITGLLAAQKPDSEP